MIDHATPPTLPDVRPGHVRRGPRLVMLLIGLAVLPLLGVASVGLTQYRDVQDSQDLADDVRERMFEVGWLEDLRLALIDERNWTVTRHGSEDAGIPLDLVAQLTGLDMIAESEAAAARVDALLDTSLGPTVADDVAAYRAMSLDDLFALGDAIEAVQDDVGARLARLRSELLVAATEAPNGSEVVMAIRASDAASTARLQHARQLWAFVAAQFSEPEAAGPRYLALAEVRQRVDEALDQVEVIAPPTSGIAEAVAEIRRSVTRQAFSDAVDDALQEAFSDRDGTGVTTNEILAELQASADVYRAGIAALVHFDDLVAVSDQVVADASAGANAQAADRFRTMVVPLGLMALVSIAIAVLLGRYVGAPMVRLADAAARLGRGERIEVDRRGPAEVRLVGDALSTAAAGLELVERLEHEATHDELTGVATRRLFQTNLDRAVARVRRTGGCGAVMFVDIDHFKDINDTYGHAAGDAVLVAISSRLDASLRMGDELGRFGGDEFVVLAEPVDGPSGAVEFAERLLSVASEPIDVSEAAGHVDGLSAADGIVVTLSIGVALFGRAPTAAADVLRQADEAVYEAKASGRDTVVLADARHLDSDTAGIDPVDAGSRS